MAVTQTGSVYTGSCSYPDTGFNISSIIIPADAEAAIIIFSNESSLSEYVPNKISWDNDTAVDFTEVVVCKGNDYPASSVAAYIMPSASGNWPGSGSGKTLYVDFSGDVSGSGGYYIGTVFFVKGLDTSDPIRNTDSSGAADNGTNQTITSNISGVVAGDLSVLFTYHWPDGSTLVTTPVGYSQTEIVSTNIGSYNELAAASRADSGAVRMTGVDYPIWAAFALKAGAAGGSSIVPLLLHQYRARRQ